MGNCKDCEHWGTPNWMARLKGTDWGICDLASSEESTPCTEGTLCYAQDHEEYEAHFYTKAEFGCVQFEAKKSS